MQSQDLTESVLPFWAAHGPDEEHGGYFTCLDRTGEVYDDRKFMWLQGRAVYTFARVFNEYDSLYPAAPSGGTGQRRAKLDRDEKRLEYVSSQAICRCLRFTGNFERLLVILAQACEARRGVSRQGPRERRRQRRPAVLQPEP